MKCRSGFPDCVAPPASIKQRRAVSQLTLLLLHSASVWNTSSCCTNMLMNCHCMHIHFLHCNISLYPIAFETSSHTSIVLRSLCSRLTGPSTMEMPGMNWASGVRNGPRGHFLPLGTDSLSPPIFKMPLENNNICSFWKRTFVTFEFTSTFNYLADALNKSDREYNSCIKLLTESRNITAAKLHFFKMTCRKNKERQLNMRVRTSAQKCYKAVKHKAVFCFVQWGYTVLNVLKSSYRTNYWTHFYYKWR